MNAINATWKPSGLYLEWKSAADKASSEAFQKQKAGDPSAIKAHEIAADVHWRAAAAAVDDDPNVKGNAGVIKRHWSIGFRHAGWAKKLKKQVSPKMANHYRNIAGKSVANSSGDNPFQATTNPAIAAPRKFSIRHTKPYAKAADAATVVAKGVDRFVPSLRAKMLAHRIASYMHRDAIVGAATRSEALKHRTRQGQHLLRSTDIWIDQMDRDNKRDAPQKLWLKKGEGPKIRIHNRPTREAHLWAAPSSRPHAGLSDAGLEGAIQSQRNKVVGMKFGSDLERLGHPEVRKLNDLGDEKEHREWRKTVQRQRVLRRLQAARGQQAYRDGLAGNSRTQTMNVTSKRKSPVYQRLRSYADAATDDSLRLKGSNGEYPAHEKAWKAHYHAWMASESSEDQKHHRAKMEEHAGGLESSKVAPLFGFGTKKTINSNSSTVLGFHNVVGSVDDHHAALEKRGFMRLPYADDSYYSAAGSTPKRRKIVDGRYPKRGHAGLLPETAYHYWHPDGRTATLRALGKDALTLHVHAERASNSSGIDANQFSLESGLRNHAESLSRDADRLTKKANGMAKSGPDGRPIHGWKAAHADAYIAHKTAHALWGAIHGQSSLGTNQRLHARAMVESHDASMIHHFQELHPVLKNRMAMNARHGEPFEYPSDSREFHRDMKQLGYKPVSFRDYQEGGRAMSVTKYQDNHGNVVHAHKDGRRVVKVKTSSGHSVPQLEATGWTYRDQTKNNSSMSAFSASPMIGTSTAPHRIPMTTNVSAHYGAGGGTREIRLREYERAHRKWMDTPVHTEEGKKAKQDLDVARTAWQATLGEGGM